MGANTVRAFKEQVDLEKVKLENALLYHLVYNCVPSFPTSLIPSCIEAINNANAGEWDKEVKLPSGLYYKSNNFAPTSECIEAWRIEFFLDNKE